MVLLLVIIEQDGRRSGFPNAPVMVEHDDKNRTEESTALNRTHFHVPPRVE